MAVTKAQKQKVVEGLKEKLEKQKMLVLFDFTGLKVKDFSNLRRKVKASGGELKVVKKTLLDIAFKGAKLGIEPRKMKGEIGLALAYEDPLSLAKEIYQFGQTNENLKIMGGFFEDRFREADEIITLAQLPPREELLSRLVGTISAPMSGLLNALEGNLKGLLFILSKAKA